MAATTSRLVQLIDWYRSQHPDVNDAEIARRLGVSRANLSQWRSAGIRGWPAHQTLVALADAIGRPYSEVLDAALADTGYADTEPQPLDSAALHAEAVRVLSAATRITYQPQRLAADGSWIADQAARPKRADWAEFVTTAVTSAAANAGSAEAALAGRPGSWEAGLVRQIIESSAGDDDQLLDWRTEAIEILINPEQIFSDTDAYSKWSRDVDDAHAELARRGRAISPSRVYIDPTDPSAEERRRWYESQGGYEIIDDARPPRQTADDLDAGPTEAPDRAPLGTAQEAALEALDALENKLEEQEVMEVAVYGRALAAAIERRIAEKLSVRVPVIVATTDSWDHEDYAATLPGPIAAAIDAAIIETPTPAALPGTPLSRIEDAGAS